MGGRTPYLGNGRQAQTGRVPYLGPAVKQGSRQTYLGDASAPKKKHHGIFATIEQVVQPVANLGTDIESAAVGVGPGLYKVGRALVHDATHPPNPHDHHKNRSELVDQVLVPLAKQYKDYYGHDLGSHLYNHPLQPLLDALTLATGGAGAAAKVGKAAADAGMIADTSRLAKLGERGTVTTRSPLNVATGAGPTKTELTSTSPLVKLREQAAAARRSSGRLYGSRTLGVKAGGRIERRGGELARYGKLIQQDAARAAYSHGQALVPYAKAVKGLSADEWTALHLRAMDIHPDEFAVIWNGKPAAKILTPEVRRLAVHPSERMQTAEPALRTLSKQGEKLYRSTGKLKEETAAARPALTKTQAAEQIGRPVRQITGDPYYFPHVPEPGKAPSPLRMEGGGKGVPKKPSSLKQNTGYLALQGKLHLRSDVLGPDFLRRVKYVKYDEIHNALTRGAVPWSKQQLTANGGLPQGWEYIRRKASEKTPVEARAEGAHVPLDQLVPDTADLQSSKLSEGFSTADPAQAATDSKGRYLIVPKTTVKAATGEFTRSSSFVHFMNRYPLRVWRAAVLGLRPGFLTNNLVGNSIMYAAKTGGNGALRDLFGAIMESRGEKVARELLDNHATPPDLRRDLYAEFFPEQTHGTFGLTQSPSTATTVGRQAAQKTGQVFNTVTGALPRLTSKVAEEYPRRALIRHYIRRSPEFKQVYTRLPKQTRTFENAARKLLEGDQGPQFQAYVSKQVNQALGDYLHLSPFERNALRNIAPFYAWYRAIVSTTYHLAADTPLRANILGQIGQIGKQWSDSKLGEIPSFLEGAIPFGQGPNGTKQVLATQGLNPYASLFQLGRGTSDLTELGINPFPQALLDQYAQATQHGGKVSPLALAAGALSNIGTGLPFAQLLAPPGPSKLYPNRNRRTILQQFFGVPVKQYSPAQAAADKRRGY